MHYGMGMLAQGRLYANLHTAQVVKLDLVAICCIAGLLQFASYALLSFSQTVAGMRLTVGSSQIVIISHNLCFIVWHDC